MKRWKLSKGIAWLWTTALLTLCVCCLPAFAAESDFDMEEGGFYNIVLLMDKSGSMNYTDPNRNAVNEAKMFAHSLYTGVQNKAKIGAAVQINLEIVPFSRDPEKDVSFIELNSDDAVNEAMSAIDAITYDRVNTGATDLGKAVAFAVERLNERNELQNGTHMGLIVLFTDGYTEYLSSDPDKAKLEAESARMLNESLLEARRNGYQIYVIGLNHEDSNGQERIKPKGRAEIKRIANETQIGEGLIERKPDEANENGKSKKNYEITPSLREIQNFYIKLFAELMRSAEPVEVEQSKNQSPPSGVAGDNFVGVYYDIPIETNRVSCCNIYVTSAGNIGDVRLFDSSGAFTSAPKVSIKKDSAGKYAILSLWRPDVGVWRVGATADAPVQVRYVPISALKIKTTPLSANDGQVEIEIRAFYDDEDLTGTIAPLFAGGLTMVSANREQTKYPIYYSPEKNVFSTREIPAPEPGRYMLYAQLMPSPAELKVSQRLWDYTGQPTLALKSEPLVAPVTQGDDIAVNLEDAFQTWDDQNTLTLTGWECSDPNASAEIDGNLLKVRTQDALPGTLDFVVHATDSLTRQTWNIPLTLDIKEPDTPTPNQNQNTDTPTPDPNPETLELEPLEVSVAQGEDIRINLEEAFPESYNRNALAITGVDCPDEKLPVEIDGNSLKIQAKKTLPTTIDLVAHATDSLTQQTWDIPVKLDVTWNPMYFLLSFWWVVPFLMALIVAMILLIFVLRKKSPPPPVSASASNPPPPADSSGVNLNKTIPLSNSQSPAGGAGVNLNKRP